MNQFLGFGQKEFLELTRTGKLLLLLLISALFGIMNPLIAKLTPWLISSMSDQLSEAGMQVNQISVDAFTSWTQFYKNIPLLLLIFAVVLSGSLTGEYQKGALAVLLTKGLRRPVVILTKFSASALLWTLGFWSCFGITYFYNSLFWTNAPVSHLFFSAFCIYVFGLWILCTLLFSSVLFSSAYGALAACGAVLAFFYFLGFLPRLGDCLPSSLLSSSALLTNPSSAPSMQKALLLTLLLLLFQLLAALLCFNKKKL